MKALHLFAVEHTVRKIIHCKKRLRRACGHVQMNTLCEDCSLHPSSKFAPKLFRRSSSSIDRRITSWWGPSAFVFQLRRRMGHQHVAAPIMWELLDVPSNVHLRAKFLQLTFTPPAGIRHCCCSCGSFGLQTVHHSHTVENCLLVGTEDCCRVVRMVRIV